jgi:predicted RecB family endonuclease
MLGITEELGEDFIKDARNLELIKKAAEGDKEALKELRKVATAEIFKDLGKEGHEAFDRIKNDVEDIVNTDIDVGVTVTLDTGDENMGIAEKLTNIYNEAY